jgi:membrane-associated protease RseP (regulator of RpoE activity)
MGKMKGEMHAVFLLLRTTKGKDAISSLAKFRFWKLFASIGIVVGILSMVLVVSSLFYALYSTYFLKVPLEGVKAVIPGVTIPFWYGIIGLITVLVVHEFSHGIIARNEGVAIRNMGAVFLTIIPIGAFLEPDEEELKQKSRASRLRVYSAGSFANIILSIFALIAWWIIGSSFGCVQIVDVMENSPAYGILEEGMVLKELRGTEISTLQDFIKATKGLKAGEKISIKTDKGHFVIEAARKGKTEKGYIGIQVDVVVSPGIAKFVIGSLWWIFFLNQGIGMINFAPIHFGVAATDGHYILKEMVSKFVEEKKAEKMTLFVSVSILVMLVFTLISPFI